MTSGINNLRRLRRPSRHHKTYGLNTAVIYMFFASLHLHAEGGGSGLATLHCWASEAWHRRTRMVEEKVFNTCPLDLTVSILLHVAAAGPDPHQHVTVRALRHSVNKAVQDPVLMSMKVPSKSAWHNKVKVGEHFASCLPIAQGRSMSVSLFGSFFFLRVMFPFFFHDAAFATMTARHNDTHASLAAVPRSPGSRLRGGGAVVHLGAGQPRRVTTLPCSVLAT